MRRLQREMAEDEAQRKKLIGAYSGPAAVSEDETTLDLEPRQN